MWFSCRFSCLLVAPQWCALEKKNGLAININFCLMIQIDLTNECSSIVALCFLINWHVNRCTGSPSNLFYSFKIQSTNIGTSTSIARCLHPRNSLFKIAMLRFGDMKSTWILIVGLFVYIAMVSASRLPGGILDSWPSSSEAMVLYNQKIKYSLKMSSWISRI